MFMPKKNRNAIFETLFKEGVMVAEKPCKKNAGSKHPDVKDVPSLQVIKRMERKIVKKPTYPFL